MSRRTAKRIWLAPNPNMQHPEVNYSGGQYDDPVENMKDYRRRLDGFLHSHKNPHYYNQEPHTHIDELDDKGLPLNTDVIEDHDNEEDYYPIHIDNNDNYPDNESHKHHTLSDIDELEEEEYMNNEHYYPNDTDKPINDDDKPYYTPDKSPENSYHTTYDGPYEDLEDFCCAYCTGQHPDNWCPTPHYSCLNTCRVPEDHPHYIDDVPVDVTCPTEGQHHPYSYWA